MQRRVASAPPWEPQGHAISCAPGWYHNQAKARSCGIGGKPCPSLCCIAARTCTEELPARNPCKTLQDPALGQRPASLVASTEAPDFRSSSTTLRWPYNAAECSGVYPQAERRPQVSGSIQTLDPHGSIGRKGNSLDFFLPTEISSRLPKVSRSAKYQYNNHH